MYNGVYSGNVLNPNVIDIEATMQMQHQQTQLSLLKRQLEELQEKQTENKLIELIKKETNYNAIRNQAIREFAEKLKNVALPITIGGKHEYEVVTKQAIDHFVKEMGVNNET